MENVPGKPGARQETVASTSYDTTAPATTSSGGDGHAATRFDRRLQTNHEAIYAFYASMAFLALVFILFHWARRVAHTFDSKNPSLILSISRRVRRTLTRKAPALPSLGHVVFVVCYVGINASLAFTNFIEVEFKFISNVGSRIGWLAVANLLVVIFLALKNTPLGLFSQWSYEQLNCLHRVAGYTTISLIIIHVGCFAYYFASDGRQARLFYTDEIFGMVAGCSVMVVGFAAIVLRRWWYELFYYTHVLFWMVAIVMVGLHQPEISKRTVCITITCAGMWFLDRLIRAARLALYSVNNSAILTPLPNGGTRVRLAKGPLGVDSGQHCYLWIPAVRSFETHPFTIASTDPLEFVIASHSGFTSDLHKYAVKHPGASVKASVEGSYGKFPDATRYDRVVLIAGGSGQTFICGVALSLLKRLPGGTGPRIDFIWIIKQKSQMEWCSKHLDTLQRDERVSVQLYITRGAAPGPMAMSKGNVAVHITPVVETPMTEDKEISTMVQSPLSEMTFDVENMTPSDDQRSPVDTPDLAKNNWDIHQNIQIKYERPKTGDLIRAAVDKTPASGSVLVMGCGPSGLMTQVRNTTAACIRTDGPVVDLHIESFG